MICLSFDYILGDLYCKAKIQAFFIQVNYTLAIFRLLPIIANSSIFMNIYYNFEWVNL